MVEFTGDSIQSPSPIHYSIPNEKGYFPAGSISDPLVSIENATLYQMHPCHHRDEEKRNDYEPLASGTLTLQDPSAGTADEVALVGRCNDTLFYIMNEDATMKTSEYEFILLFPEFCTVMDLAGCSSNADILQVESLLAARTKFHDESQQSSTKETTLYPANLPDDMCSRALFRASTKVARLAVSAGEYGSSKIDAYGEKKKESIVQSKEVKVGKASVMIASGVRTVSEKTYNLTEKVSGKISDVLGGKVGRAVAKKESDTAIKRKARSLLLASSICFAEVGSGASESYEVMVKSAQSQATSFVAKKYGKEAAELARHTAG